MKNSSLWIILQRMRAPFLVIVVTYTISIIGLLLIPGADSSGKPYQMTIFDAFYFITYTATTIGFGEIPYAFTYPQRMWVSFSVYFNVLGWFYGIGTLVALLQDKFFLQEIAKGNFRRQIKNLKEKYILVLGYNLITAEIIKKAIEEGIRAVVVEKDQTKIDELLLENFTPHVPVLNADAYSPQALVDAGIHSIYCQAVTVLFQNDDLNLRIATTVKLLNPKVRLAVKATTHQHTEMLQDLGAEIIENPFEIIATQTQKAIQSPHLLRLERWLYGTSELTKSYIKFPKGNYVICGYGRMGEVLYKVLKKHGNGVKCLEIDPTKLHFVRDDEKDDVLLIKNYDKKSLMEAGTQTASMIIAGTKNDTTNLTIAILSKKLNPKIKTIVRENEMEDFSVFQNTKVDRILMPSRILIDKTINAIIRPTADTFVRNIHKLTEQNAAYVIKSLLKIDNEPLLEEITISKNETYEIHKRLDRDEKVTLDIFRKSLSNANTYNNVFILMIARDESEIFLPQWSEPLLPNDVVLLGCDKNALDDITRLANNPYEYEYALTGKERPHWLSSLTGSMKKSQ